MAEFVEVMKQQKRMCKNLNCLVCPISNNNCECVDYLWKYPQQAEEIIMGWAKEHPIKTNADMFREVFGTEVDKSNSCLFNCGNNVCSKCEYNNFWEQEYKETKGE